jgi:hypothetical protein
LAVGVGHPKRSARDQCNTAFLAGNKSISKSAILVNVDIVVIALEGDIISVVGNIDDWTAVSAHVLRVRYGGEEGVIGKSVVLIHIDDADVAYDPVRSVLNDFTDCVSGEAHVNGVQPRIGPTWNVE